MEPRDYKYWAFISYSHQDRAWGNWLHRALETYRLPRRLVGREHWSGPLPQRLAPVFRDRDELPSSADLNSVINQALRDSRYLIVICSPQSASSRWVNEEIKHFKALGRADRVLPLIVGGEPNASDKPESGLAECLPAAVRFEVTPQGELTDQRTEPIAADARGGKDGRADALLKIIAGLIGVGFDELKQRERQRLLWQRAINTAAIVALILAAAGFWRGQQIEKQHALDAQQLKNRIATLYESGRQELLAHNEARAAAYLNEAFGLGMDTPALRFMLGQAMRVIDTQVARTRCSASVWMLALDDRAHRLACVGTDQHLQVWDTSSGRRQFEHDLIDVQRGYITFSPTGRLILTDTYHASEPHHRLGIYEAATGVSVSAKILNPQQANFSAMPFDSREERITYIDAEGSLMVSVLNNGGQQRLPGKYTAARFQPGGNLLLAGTPTGLVDLIDAGSGRVLRHLVGLEGPVVALDADASGIVAAGSANGAMRAWNSASGKVLLAAGHNFPLVDLHLSAGGMRLMSLTRNSLDLWDVAHSSLIFANRLQDPSGAAASISNDGQYLAVNESSRVAMVDSHKGNELYAVDGYAGTTSAFAFGTAPGSLATGAGDGSVIHWQLPPEQVYALPSGTADVAAGQDPPETPVAYSIDGHSLFAGGADGSGWLIDAQTGHRRVSFAAHQGPVSAAAFEPKGELLATGGWDRHIRLWRTANGTSAGAFAGTAGRVWSLAYNHDGSVLAGAIEGGKVAVWNAVTHAHIAELERDNLSAYAFNSTGSFLFTGSHGVVFGWSMPEAKQRWARDLGTAEEPVEITAIASSPNENKLLATTTGKIVILIDGSSGRELSRYPLPDATGLYTLSVSPDGTKAVIGDTNKSVFILQLSNGSLLNLIGHSSQITSVAFSPDGNLVLSASADGTIKFWDATTGTLLQSASAHDGSVGWNNAYFSPDGRKVLSGGTDNTARMLQVARESRDSKALDAALRCRIRWRVRQVSLVQQTATGCSTPEE